MSYLSIVFQGKAPVPKAESPGGVEEGKYLCVSGAETQMKDSKKRQAGW